MPEIMHELLYIFVYFHIYMYINLNKKVFISIFIYVYNKICEYNDIRRTIWVSVVLLGGPPSINYNCDDIDNDITTRIVIIGIILAMRV
jgi:hypothetical protein